MVAGREELQVKRLIDEGIKREGRGGGGKA